MKAEGAQLELLTLCTPLFEPGTMALISVVREQGLTAGMSLASSKETNYYGFTAHMSIKKFPRFILELIRDTYQHQTLKTRRPLS